MRPAAPTPRAAALPAMQLLLHPFTDKRSLLESARRRNPPHRQAFVGTERDANRVSDLFAEHGLADFVELVSEVRNAVGVPELSKLSFIPLFGATHAPIHRPPDGEAVHL